MFRRRNRLGSYHTSFTRNLKESSWNFWWKFFKRVLIITFCVGIIWFFLFSSFFTVNNIEISGTQLVAKKAIIDILPKGENIFLYPVKEKNREILSHYPEISSTAIFRGLPNSIKIEITEYSPSVLWKRNITCGFVNENGIFYYLLKEELTDFQLPLVIENIPSQLKVKDQVATASFITFVKEVKEGFFDLPQITFDHVELGVNNFDIVIKTKENIDILMSTDEDLNRQLFYLKEILEKRRDKVTKKIDVRIPRWGYVE